MHEWKNKNREEARIDLTIQDFGRTKQAHGDYTIRSIDTTHLQKIGSALRQGHARDPNWTEWTKLMSDAEQEKKADHPLRTAEGPHVLNAEFFPLVFSPFGTMGPGAHGMIRRVRELRGPSAAQAFKDSLSIALARLIADRIRMC